MPFPMPNERIPNQSRLRTQRTIWIIGLILGASVSLVLAYAGPGSDSICLIKLSTGTACPGCGMTRATSALLRGDLANTWRLHPLAPVLAIQAVVLWVIWGWLLFRHRAPIDEAMLLQILIGNSGLMLVVWIVRLAKGTLPG